MSKEGFGLSMILVPSQTKSVHHTLG